MEKKKFQLALEISPAFILCLIVAIDTVIATSAISSSDLIKTVGAGALALTVVQHSSNDLPSDRLTGFENVDIVSMVPKIAAAGLLLSRIPAASWKDRTARSSYFSSMAIGALLQEATASLRLRFNFITK